MQRPVFHFVLLALISLACLSINPLSAATTSLKSDQLQPGFFGLLLDRSSGKLYLQVSNLDAEFIYQTSLPNGLGSNDVGLDRGQLSDTRLVKFERFGNKLLLRQLPTRYRAHTNNMMEVASIEEAFASSVLWGFEIVEQGTNSVLVDATEFALQDIHGVGRILQQQQQGKGYKVDPARSAVDPSRTASFPDNTEIQSLITLVGSEPGQYVRDTVPEPTAISLKMRHSFVRLPDDGYQPRAYLPKSGYWTTQFMDYAQPINEPITQRYIGRHRLQKVNPGPGKSPVREPIVYYLDPGVPEPVRSALLDGARWWQAAFDELGFENGYQVKMLPADADPMDVRYNVIQWVHRATRGWSYGSSVADPRTGEIIKGHVTLGSLRVRQDYLLAQGMMAPFAESEDDSALMALALARIRQLSAHEVGHTLGLLHNFAASTYGRESVMDYPHPVFELDGDRVVAPNAYGVGIGEWDKAAIAYGYQEFAADSGALMRGEAEVNALEALLVATDNRGLVYINDQDARSPGSPHVRASLWDNGADPVAELARMYQVRRQALLRFGAANLKVGSPWSDLEEILVPVFYSHRYQLTAAAKAIGGWDYDYARKGDPGAIDQPKLVAVDATQQRLAMQTILESLTPSFLTLPASVRGLMVPKAAEYARSRESISGQTGVSFDFVALASKSAQHSLAMLLHPERLMRLQQQHAINPSMPSVSELGQEIHRRVINLSTSGLDATVHESVVDLVYTNYLNLLHSADVPVTLKSALISIIDNEIKYLKAKLKRNNDPVLRYQLARLEAADPASTRPSLAVPTMPPGSPI
ncbi:periplasmic metalloprotease [Arenicella chitinivorans]|uniref:Periplasmic metalloprotease n=1 Tax=Arenicella chitinivorans TaxID=1329800 RepID=A0A918VJS0_9GAMM|nr:zinc-dependent metalloprotease [Arenicella chitinivorans]GHA01495.1 periplasmic metalloprotease [Arenicella chitinivorans]